MEQLNLGSEVVKSSKRRLSSILKAPRTSIHEIGVDQEEQKEDIPKPVEKKRNSRRVSFATTNNVRVFTNDAKNESPVLASIQNTHVDDRRDEKILRFVGEGNHQIKGMETLLNTPLYRSQHKENFFSDPVLQDDCVDRTMILGEDTGYMDITHSHTIIVDKDYVNEEEANPNFSVKVAQTVCGDANVANQKCEAKADKKTAATDADFSAFLASMSLPVVNTNEPQKSKKEPGSIFCPANASTLEVDKENHLPSFIKKQGGMGNPQQPRGLQRRRSRVSFVEDDNIEPTISHTIVAESKDNSQPFAASFSENPRSVAFTTSAISNNSDDMELTLRQTAAINVKVTGSITHNVQAALDHNRSHYFSEDTNAMEMTGAFDVSVREKDHMMSIEEQAPVPKVKRISSFNVIGSAETTDQNKSGSVQSNLSIVQTASSDEMEMTGALNVSLRQKGEALFPKASRMSTFDVFGNGQIVDQNKAVNHFIFPAVNSDDMEMTQCQTIVLEDESSSGKKSFSNSRKSLPLSSVSRTIQEHEHTKNMKEETLPPVSRVSKMSCYNSVENRVMMDHHKSGHHMMVQTAANSDDMEITQCQTVVLEDEPSSKNKSFSNSKKSLPLASLFRTIPEHEHTENMKEETLPPVSRVSKISCYNSVENRVMMDHHKSGHHMMVQTAANYDDMEITQCQTIVLEDEPSSKEKSRENTSVSRTEGIDGMDTSCIIPNAQRKKGEGILIPASATLSEHNGSECMDLTCQPFTLAGISPPSPDEIELTGCNTINMDCVDITGTRRAISFANQTITVVEPMEMTAPFSEQKRKAFMTRRKSGALVSLKCDYEKTEADTCQTDFSSPADMDMTHCQTVVLEPEYYKGTTPFNKLRKSLNIVTTYASPDDDGMEITQALTGNTVLKSFASKEERTNEKNPLPTAQSCQTQYVSDCMELTGQAPASNLAIPCVDDEMELTCNTIAIDSKSTLAASAAEIKVNESVLWATTSVSRCTVSSEEQNEVSKSAKCAISIFPSKHVFDPDSKNLKCNNKETMLDHPVEIQVDKNFCAFLAGMNLPVVNKTECQKSEKELGSVFHPANASTLEVGKEDHLPSFLMKKGGKSNPQQPQELQHRRSCVSFVEDSTGTMSGGQADILVEKTPHPNNVMAPDENDDMQLTKALTMTTEVELNQRDVADVKSSCGSRIEEEGQSLLPNKEGSTSSVQLEGSSADSLSDSFMKEELQNAKSRRRSLADFQMELHMMSQCIQEEQNFMTGSKTAPLPSCSLPEISLKERCETEIFTEPTSNVTPNVKKKNNAIQNEKTTPFSLKKKPFSSRISLCGIVPKLPKRATTTPNKTATISANDLQCLPLEKHLDVVEQKSNYETVDINDEEFPEMSSLEDSGSFENWPINKQDELDGSLPVPTKEESFEDDVFVSDTSPCFKRPHPEEDPITAEQTKKACVSDMGPGCHETAVQWEGNFTRHGAQNPKAKTIEDTGVSESSLRYSQFDSHMDGTVDQEFDFSKKLEDGSITVVEFLKHFGIKFVIHGSRPSILPESCRAGETRTMEYLLKEKYIYHPRQRVYEQDCKNLTEIVDRLKEQMPQQEKPLGNLNGALQQEICTLSKEQLKSFGSKLKERNVYFGKRSKARSHEMKGVLYSELIKTTQDAKHSLISKIKETNEMMEDLDGLINELETELASVEAVIIGGHLDAPQTGPALKAKENDLRRLNSAVTEKEREIGELEIQLRTLEGQQEKLRGESSGLKSHLATLNSLNEWHLDATDERGALFTLLHKTVHLQVNLQTPAGKEWMTEDVERNIDVCFQLQLDGERSECHASMVHKLIALYHQSQAQWTQRYPTTRHIPKLLLDVSLLVSRLRLLGEEIHRLKKWGGLKLRILKITCMDTRVHIIFSSPKAFEKFEFSLLVTPDYPFGALAIQDFKKHMGNTRLSQIEAIISSVKPDKNYLTKVLKRIHDDLLC